MLATEEMRHGSIRAEKKENMRREHELLVLISGLG
jgi:hypothetical protein